MMVSSQNACTATPSDAVKKQGVRASKPMAWDVVMYRVKERMVNTERSVYLFRCRQDTLKGRDMALNLEA